MRDFLDLVDAAVATAEEAAQLLRRLPTPSPSAWAEKGPSDFVTEVDREAEHLIAEALQRRVPGSVVRGEELTPDAQAAENEVIWIVDPLDGTANYLHGYPQYAVSIAAVADGQLAAGVVADVTRQLTYRAWRGGGAWLGSRRLAVSSLVESRWALVGTGHPFKRLDLLDGYQRQFAAVMRGSAGVRRTGSAALDLADVAAGRFDAFWELELAPWDVAAGVLLIREAGGVVTTLDGNPDVIRTGAVVAGNPSLHAWLLDLLQHSQ